MHRKLPVHDFQRSPTFKPTSSRGIHIANPILCLAQVFLGYNLFDQANTSSSITHAELYFMWCMKEQRKVHLGYWIAYACHSIATHAVRHLNVCHLLGAFVKNNLTIEVAEGVHPTMCPQPELIDTRFFVNVKIMKVQQNRLYFYEVGQPDLQVARVPEPRDEERSKDGEEATAPVGDWQKKMEKMMYHLG